MSGLMRRLIAAVRCSSAATRSSRTSSLSDSTLKHMIPAESACAHLLLRLAHAGEDDLAGIAARREHARELAARNDVEPASQARKEVQHREARIGLDRVAHQVVGAGERRIVGAPGLDERRARVDEARRSVLLGDPAERDRLGVQLAVPVVEVVHCRV